MKVEIRKKAFVPFVLSAVEVFKKETSGLILGRFENGKVVVKTCIPCQESERQFSHFNFHERRLEMMQKVIEEFCPKTNYNLLGYFHSHPEYGGIKCKAEPSKGDKDWILEEKEGLIFLFIAIWKAKRKQKWLIKERKVLAGTASDYHFDISIYFRKGRRIRKAKIIFPRFLG